MKMIVVAFALVAVAIAAPPVAENQINILNYRNDQGPDGSYGFGFESEDGTSRQEDGELKKINDEENKPHDVVVVRGTYTYIDSDNNPQTVTYYADETGFHAEGDSIPKKPVRR